VIPGEDSLLTIANSGRMPNVGLGDEPPYEGQSCSSLERTMKTIYQVEVSNHCNLTCHYCPHPGQKRSKGNMSLETFERVLELHITLQQRRVALHNFGDPLMHPNIVEFVRMAKAKVGLVTMSTNGVALTKDMALQLKEAGLDLLAISKHTNDADAAIEVAESIDLRMTVRKKFDHDWGGTAKPHKVHFRPITERDLPLSCAFLQDQMAVVLWNGDVNVCCVDAEGRGVVGNVREANITSQVLAPISLCGNCYYRRSFDQDRAINWILKMEEPFLRLVERKGQHHDHAEQAQVVDAHSDLGKCSP